MSSFLEFMDRFHNFANRMMGVKPRRKPEDPKPLYATFQDRVFASAIDLGLVVMLCYDLFRWMTARIYAGFDPQRLQPENPLPDYAPTQDQVRQSIEMLFSSGFAELWLLNSFLQSVVGGVLLIATWHFFNTTPGKWIIGLKFADKETMEAPSLVQYIKRFLGFYLSLPIFMIGFAALGFSKTKQAWHDRIAGTVVIYTEEGSIFHRAYRLIRNRIKKS